MDRSSESSRLRSGGAGDDDGLGQPRADVRFALGFETPQPIDRQPAGRRDEPGFGVLDTAGLGLVPPDVGFLDDVLGIGARAEHAVGEARSAGRGVSRRLRQRSQSLRSVVLPQMYRRATRRVVTLMDGRCRMTSLRTVLAAVVLNAIVVPAPSSTAAEITVWTTRALATVLAEIGGEFERETGHKLVVTSDLPPAFARRAGRGGAVRSPHYRVGATRRMDQGRADPRGDAD